MNEQQFRELNELRTYLNTKQKQKLANNLKIRELQAELHPLRNELQDALRDKRQEMLKNKELRTQHECTNQKEWEAKIRKLTHMDEVKIEESTMELEDQIQALRDENDIIRIRVEDTRWELTLKNGYYQDNPELVQVTPVKEAV